MPLILVFALSLGLISSDIGSAQPPKDSPSVAKRLTAVRTSALTLQSDTMEMACFARDSSGKKPQKTKILGDIHTGDSTVSELQELRKIASPAQAEIIRVVLPIMQDLLENTRDALNHAVASETEAQREANIEYLAAHAELANHLSSRIVEILGNAN